MEIIIPVILAGLASLGGIVAIILGRLFSRNLTASRVGLISTADEAVRFDLAESYRMRLETLERWKEEIAVPSLALYATMQKDYSALQLKYAKLNALHIALRDAVQVIQEQRDSEYGAVANNKKRT